ncbi:hypothetical protein [Singulisphaera sp. PoT]|uniref:hypothetical protein n=1 Tax=Singulisphaera sp. PoT TaxID=3411797 RepID=UPI003BF47CCC
MDRPDREINILEILRAALDDYALPWHGVHGIAHWGRVYENGLRLVEATGADAKIVRLFAVLHDSKRVNEFTDPEHGPRAADFAESLNGRFFSLPDADMKRLHRACFGHTHELTHPDVTIQTCWDADRLDLGRVGITPHPKRLCTEFARHPETIRWADGRARMGMIPKLIEAEWGFNLASLR